MEVKESEGKKSVVEKERLISGVRSEGVTDYG